MVCDFPNSGRTGNRKLRKTRQADRSQARCRRLLLEHLEDRRLLAAGDLDPTFGGDGKVTTGIGASYDFGRSVALQSDGKIVVAGTSHNGSNWDFALARYEGTTNQPPSDIDLTPSTVAENQPSGTLVGTFSTTDPDAGDVFTCTLVSGLGDSDNTSFTIAGSQLQTAVSFDYETKNSYSIRVRTTDQGGLWYEEALAITVTDVDEIPPTVTVASLITNDPTPAMTGTVSDGTLQVAINGTTYTGGMGI